MLPGKMGLGRRKKIALVAHDNKKDDMLVWVTHNRELLSQHAFYATGTTGTVLEEALGLTITVLQSGPLGGDQQIGARIAEGEINILIFFWDPLEAQPHDPDVRALLRMAAVWNIPVATTLASADFLITSPLMSEPYDRRLTDYQEFTQRMKNKSFIPVEE